MILPNITQQLHAHLVARGVTAGQLAAATGITPTSAQRFLDYPDREHWSSTINAIGELLEASVSVRRRRAAEAGLRLFVPEAGVRGGREKTRRGSRRAGRG